MPKGIFKRRKGNGTSKHSLLPPTIFPWAEPKQTITSRGFKLTIYQDNSRLYQFNKGGHLILTPEGVNVLKGDRRIIKRYLGGGKLPLTSGGNSNLFLVTGQELPIVFKEHHSGMSAKTQMEHMREIREKLLKAGSIHEVPVYYGTASFPPHYPIRDVSVMELKNAKKVEKYKEELKKANTPESLTKLDQLGREFEKFKRQLEKRNFPITDFHEGNILTEYNPVRKRFVFIVVDQ